MQTGKAWIPAMILAGIFFSAVRAEPGPGAASGHYVRHGVVIDFEAKPVSDDVETLTAGKLAEVRIRLTEEATGAPVTGVTPGVWLDIADVLRGKEGAQQKSCKEKIALYLKGVVGIRPMLDLNSYYIVVMNQEPSLSIIDPLVSMAGVTSTLGQISLGGIGSDWAPDRAQKRLFVSMPDTGKVAVVDTSAFEVSAEVEAGSRPTRVAVQPDGRYLWVGNDADEAADSGVTVIDTASLDVVAAFATGRGHHEIAFSGDSRLAFVSNRESGTVTVVDVATLKKRRDLETGPLPISLAYSELADALYVADGKSGEVTVIGGKDADIEARIALAPGLGPLSFAPGARYALAVNPSADTVYVVDATSNRKVQEIAVKARPYQVSYSRAFAYVRALGSPYVTMINLASLGEGEAPIVQGFDAGAGSPLTAGALPLASGMAFTSSEAAVFIVNPADNTTFLYMEGMNAASGNYRVYGASARAVTVVDRSMREEAPGEFVSTVKIPAAGHYDVAFMLETPQILHCFAADAVPGAEPSEKQLASLAVEYLVDSQRVTAEAELPLRFRLTNKASDAPLAGLRDVSVLFFRTPGADRTVVPAVAEGDGVYLAQLPIGRPGGYYVYVGLPDRGIGYEQLPFFTLAAVPARARP